MYRITQGVRHKLWTFSVSAPRKFQINETANVTNRNLQVLTGQNLYFQRGTNHSISFQRSRYGLTNENDSFVSRTNHSQGFQLSRHLSSNQNDLFVQKTNHGPGFHPSCNMATSSVTATTEAKPQDGRQYPNFDVKFDDFRAAFGNKSKWELIRALSVLRLCSFSFLADNALKIMETSQKVLGKRLSGWLMKRIVYDQFVAGETTEEIQATAKRIQDVNVGLLLAAPMEDDVDSFHLDVDKDFGDNLDTIVNSISLARDLDPVFPMIQMRITGLLPGDLCLTLSERCPQPSSHAEVIESVARALRGQPLDIDQTFGTGLADETKHQLKQGIARVAKVCQVAREKEVMVMVDAEYTYINPALSLFTLAMMVVCNDTALRPPLVFNTYQNYLKNTRKILDRDLQYAENRGIGFAAKLVRGAYLNREKMLAAQEGYPDPIQDSYEDTSRAYDSAMKTMLTKVAAKPRDYRLIVASHNEETMLSALKGLQELDIDPLCGQVFFGQLMGMADHISCSLGLNGFLIRKSVPYGPLDKTLPYLSRRALENKAVFHGTRRERKLLKSELRRRFSLRPVA